ncbi:MBL fold metallo-hydrolase [Paenibacillus sp. J22TS3]|uniref:MBL fold metallo-hydrolase n=1 Tax=Paenibacillus sp. J22TS3 TaxID=2807192 RepID=UPI001B1B1D6F|nr:MBL fold metallo-hydrolase [Paenibacillus sp. J22TS3]GIP23778.1 hydrolase [Paenibacillus sp. J22TS3]
MLDLVYPAGDTTMTIHPVVIYDREHTVLIDTGMPGSRDMILKQMTSEGIDVHALDTIILTHQDIDHIGSLPQFIGSAGNLEILAHEEDAPYIEGIKPLIKVSSERRATLLSSLTEEDRIQFEQVFSPSTRPKISRMIKDNERLPYGGGLLVIHTPGHTPGHLSLYHEPSQTLIAGDAMILQDGELHGPNPKMTPDLKLATESLSKFAELPVRKVICYHGGLLDSNAEKQIKKLTSH